MKTVLALALASALVTATAPTAGAAIGPEWDLGSLAVLAVGDLASNPGLEVVAMDPYGAVAVYELGSGAALGPIPDPFASRQTTFILRDLDGDGFADILCLYAAQPLETRIGAFTAGRGPVRALWQTQGFAEDLSFADTVNLNRTEASAVALTGGNLLLLSGHDGTLLYDSAADPAVGPDWAVQSVVVEDFDGDGFDEALLETLSALDYRTGRSFLIGDLALTSGVGAPATPDAAHLDQNRPNPLNGSTTIRYTLDEPGRARLRIYDAAGRLVRTLADGSAAAGAHSVAWNGRDDRGRATASGIYFYELDVDGHREARKLVQVR